MNLLISPIAVWIILEGQHVACVRELDELNPAPAPLRRRRIQERSTMVCSVPRWSCDLQAVHLPEFHPGELVHRRGDGDSAEHADNTHSE
jgi:hypothetical protein